MATVKAWGPPALPRISAQVLDAASVVGLLVCWLGPVLAWPWLPERIPVHLTLTGEVDAWGSRAALFLLPALGTPPLVLLHALVRQPARALPRHAQSLDDILRSLFRWIRTLVVWLLCLMQWELMAVATGHDDGRSLLVLALGVGALLATVAGHLRLAWRAR
ncbi:MAG: DUF1648 domain-containing protein [Myxococcota bacterium]